MSYELFHLGRRDVRRHKLKERLSSVRGKLELLPVVFLLSAAIYTHVIYYGYQRSKNEKKRKSWT